MAPQGEVVSLTGQLRAKDQTSPAFRRDRRTIGRPANRVSSGFLQNIKISSTKPRALLHCDETQNSSAIAKAYRRLTKVLVFNTSRPIDEVNSKCEIGLSFREPRIDLGPETCA